MNKFYYQLRGPFNASENILDKIKQENSSFEYASKIGIQAKPTTIIQINGRDFEIGKTGILEFSEEEINSIIFNTAQNNLCIIDLIIKS